MGVLSASIYMQASEEFTSQSVLREHTAYRMFDEAFRMLLTNDGGRMLTLSSRITRVRKDNAIGPFLSGHSHFLRVDHDDVVTAVSVRLVACLMLAADDAGHLACHTTQYLGIGINHHPALFSSCFRGLGRLIAIVIHFGC